jgi:hypothetical protein
MRRLLITSMLFLSSFRFSSGDPVVHKFQIWTAITSNKVEKRILLLGWTNGYI